MAVVRCANCKQYTRREDAIRVGIQNFCQEECRARRKPKTRSKVQRESFQKKKRIQQDREYAANRKVALDRDRHCRICRAREGLQVHHIVFRSQGLDHGLHNLIVLCNACHSDYAHGAEAKKYRNLFRAYIWLRLVEDRCYAVLIPEIERAIMSK